MRPEGRAGARWRRRAVRLLVAAAVLVGLAVGVRELLFRGPERAPAPLAAGGIVDLHCHVAGLGAHGSGCFVSEALRSSWRFGVYLGAFGVSEEELREHGDALVVQRIAGMVASSELLDGAVLLAMDGVIGKDGELDEVATEVYVPNEFVARETAREERLLFGASVNPYRRDALERLDGAVARGAVLLKWLPSIQEIDPADPRLVPFYRRLREHGLPLLSHTGEERSFTRARDEFGDPARLRLALEQGVTVIAAHAATQGESGGETFYEHLLELLEEFPNLYVDVSSLTQLNKLGHLRRVLDEPRFAGRLVHGSDYPLVATGLVSAWYYPFDLTVAQMQEISGMDNVLDQDVALKRALGVPADVFTRSLEVLRPDAIR